MRDSMLEEMKRNYDNIEIPEELKVKVVRSMKQAKADAIRKEQVEKQRSVFGKTKAGLAVLFSHKGY